MKSMFWRSFLFVATALGLGATGALPAAERAAAPAFENAALLIIDIQSFYFEGGRIPLVGSIEASLKAKQVLEAFRAAKRPVIHVQHMPKQDPAAADPQYAIHSSVAPLQGETIVVKHYANAFRETDLAARLKGLGAKTLVICGMQTHMCVEAAVRHAADLGYEVILVEDACATRDLSFGGTTVSARLVHTTVLAAMNGTYAKVVMADALK